MAVTSAPVSNLKWILANQAVSELDLTVSRNAVSRVFPQKQPTLLLCGTKHCSGLYAGNGGMWRPWLGTCLVHVALSHSGYIVCGRLDQSWVFVLICLHHAGCRFDCLAVFWHSILHVCVALQGCRVLSLLSGLAAAPGLPSVYGWLSQA